MDIFEHNENFALYLMGLLWRILLRMKWPMEEIDEKPGKRYRLLRYHRVPDFELREPSECP
jgi:hypothetical protein